MGFLDRFLGRSDEPREDVTEAEHERHVEQSRNPGEAPTLKPDTSEASADEVEQSREEPRGEEELLETQGRDDQGMRDTRLPPRPY